jgi:hypothetical protein
MISYSQSYRTPYFGCWNLVPVSSDPWLGSVFRIEQYATLVLERGLAFVIGKFSHREATLLILFSSFLS